MIIELKDINYYYPNSSSQALKDINLKIEDGEFVLITGSSGSGKSTLIRCITGTVPDFYGGKIGGDILKTDELISMVFQDPERQLLMNKVYREISFGLENMGLNENTIKKRIWESLEFCGITDLYDRDIKTLSGGQKQKVAIASALAFMPKCLILDEPTSQLDPISADEVLNIVKKINKELMINVIVVEQRISRWFEYVDKIVVMKSGMIEFVGNKEDMYKSQNKYVETFLPSKLRIARKLGMEEYPKGNIDIKNKIKAINLNNNIEPKVDKDILLQIQNITIKYDEFMAVKDVSFNIKKGEVVALLGANGAGKSTLLKSIIGLLDYKGSIKFNGEKIDRLKTKDRAKFIGYLSQNPNDYITKDTVYDELLFTLSNFNIEDNGVIDEVLKRLDIYTKKYQNPRDLSGGEKQRLALANVLILKPSILLLDEPTRGVDVNVKLEISKMLRDLSKEGVSTLVVTHDVEFATEVADRFMLMFNGEIVEVGDYQILEDCIYYTTEVNKLIKEIRKDVFTYSQFLCALEGNK